MKHLATLILAIVLLPLGRMPAAGQTSLALTGGVNIASVDVEDDSGFVPYIQSVTRISLGLAVDFPFSERWGLQLGGRYSQKGLRLESTDEDAWVWRSMTELDYLEFTVLGRLRFPVVGDRLSGHLQTGPAVAVETSCEFSTTVQFPDGAIDHAADRCESNWERSVVDIGWALGGSLDIGITENLSAHPSLLYIRGLVDIDPSDDTSIKHRVLTLRIGFAYALR